LADKAKEWRNAYRDLGQGIVEPDRKGKNGNSDGKELQAPEEPPFSDDMEF
jgi:hypothetical protein